MRLWGLLLASMLLAIGACDAPPSTANPGAAVVSALRPRFDLPEPVQATLVELNEIAASGSYRDMAKLADQTPGFRSNDAGWSHKDFWYLKLRAGDWPMAQMQKILDYPPAVIETPEGRLHVWPYMALAPADAITPEMAQDIDRLVGAGQADAMRAGQPWQGYSLGIREDGAWVYFLSGAS